MNTNEIGKKVAEYDQLVAGFGDMAKVVNSYYKAMLEAGFDDMQAMGLTMGFQEYLLGLSDNG